MPRCLLPLALVLALPLVSCGSSDNGVASKQAGQILASARAAAQSASSVHMVASSKITHGGSLKLDGSLAKDQAHVQVSLFGMTMEVIRDGDTLYVKGNRQFDERLEVTLGVKVPSGKWLKGTTSSLGQIGSFTEIDRELPVILSGSGKVTKGAKVEIDGQPAITLKLTRKLYSGTLYVATTGEPYPLKLLKRGRETGQTTFTGWNDPVSLTPPANAIEISQLQHVKGR
jgi:hypothetical protein